MKIKFESPETQILHFFNVTRSTVNDWDSAQTERYIYYGEFELALAGISYAYVARGMIVATDVKDGIASLANDLKMLEDPEWDSTLKILSANKNDH